MTRVPEVIEVRHAALSTIAKITREECRTVWGSRTCIITTRVLIQVLEYFGQPARPQPVIVAVINQAAIDYLDQHPGTPPDEWPPQAWSVGVNGTGISNPATKNWDGHLVALLDDATGEHWLIDASLDQLSRPERGIELEPAVLLLNRPWDGRRESWTSPYGALIYEATPTPGDWRHSPDWRSQRAQVQRVAGAAIRRLREIGT